MLFSSDMVARHSSFPVIRPKQLREILTGSLLRGRWVQVGSYVNFAVFDQCLAGCGKLYKIEP